MVQSNVSHTLGSNVENLKLTGTSAINGNGSANKLTCVGAERYAHWEKTLSASDIVVVDV